MAAIPQRILVVAALLLGVGSAEARKFYTDDPLARMPAPRPIKTIAYRPLNEIFDAVASTLSKTPAPNRRASNANTVDGVPDSEWFTNRHAAQRLSVRDLIAGAGDSAAPAEDGIWEVTGWKSEGQTPGFQIRDAAGRNYLIKLDPARYPEIASAAETVGSVFFHAMGYNVPQNYVVRFHPDRLRVASGAMFPYGNYRQRPMVLLDVLALLRQQQRDKEGRVRALASLALDGKPMGPFRYHGTRTDDPNDIVPHEHRRELRGMLVPAAWLNHTDVNALNTLDTLVGPPGGQYLRHNLVDFGSILGSDNVAPKTPRSGFEGLFEKGPTFLQMFSLGLWIPDWARARYPDIDSVGRFEAEFFQPDRWRPNYPNPAFAASRPDDWLWGLKLILAFTEDDVRLILRRAEYSDPQATEWVLRALMKRREKLARYYLDKLLPLDDFRLDERVQFKDLAQHYGFEQARSYQYQWGTFDNERERFTAIPGATTPVLPPQLGQLAPGSFCAVRVQAGDAARNVTAYFRRGPDSWGWVGIDRSW